jgi:outer membrane protein TolC
VSRPFRLPGKASLDRKAGDLGIDAAHNRMEDVRHQTSLLLAALWYDWLTAADLARTDGQSVANLEQALTAVTRRAELRDAAPLERDQAESALALARGQQADALALASEARVTLAANFPDLPLPQEPPRLAKPHGSLDDFAALRDLVIARSHEIGAARAEADRLSVLARRSQADRIADPSLGFRLFSERGGAEKGVGVVASLPIGGRYRARAADEAGATARSAAMELSVVERQVQAMADADLSNARTRLAAWRDMDTAATRAGAVVARTVKGYELGAIDLADRLYAERQANDARRAEVAARGEALRAILKLEIDSHVLWAPAGEEEE